MGKQWDPDELIEAWTLGEADWELVGNKTGATRLGFSLMLKFYELEGRFPAYAEEVPTACGGVRRVAGEGGRGVVHQVLLAGSDDQVSPGADPQGVRDAAGERGR